MSALAFILSVGLAQAPATPEEKQAEAVARLKRDIRNTNRAIEETERLIAVSSDRPYLPDLSFRLAELYVEKSRYVFHLQAESRPRGQKGAIVSTETRLLKQKAVEIYERLLKEAPDFKQADKVTFYLAHEQRELGQFDEMLKTLRRLSESFPKSPLRLEAEQILGDHYFDKADNAEAEKHYLAILEASASPVHDLARYKMGWICVNQAKHAEAVTFFAAAASSPPAPGADPKKALNVKREALLDLVYSYTEVRSGKGALSYFEKLADSPLTYAQVLEKLGNRYFIKQQYEFAVPAYRRLLELSPDARLDLERVQRLDDALRLAKGKALVEPSDVGFAARAAEGVRADHERGQELRQKELLELEEIARDWSTQLHVAAKNKDDAALFADAAEAYRTYLGAFSHPKHHATMQRNRADALFAAEAFIEAGRTFERLARGAARPSKVHEPLQYAALLSYNRALQRDAGRLSPFAKTDARQALKLVGADYVALYPRSEQAPGVRFNLARAHYDDGEFKVAAERFAEFALAYGEHKDAATAGHLALDALRHLGDFDGIKRTGRRLLGARVNEKFRGEVRAILASTEARQLDELALRGAQETGDVVEGLIKLAEEHKSASLGEKALYGAITASREGRDFAKERELTQKFLAEYPRSPLGAELLAALGRSAAESARFFDAAALFEQAAQRLGSNVAAVGAWEAAANLRAGLGQKAEAARNLTKGAELGGGRRSALLAKLAELHLELNDPARAKASATQVLAQSPQHGRAAAVLAELEARAAVAEPSSDVVQALKLASQSPGDDGAAVAKGLWYVGEILYASFKQLPAQELEQKAAALAQLEALYSQVASLGSAEWSVAGLLRVGNAYAHLAFALKSAPAPEGLSAADLGQWKAAVEAQREAFASRAEQTLQLCTARADELGIYTVHAASCRRREEAAKLGPLPALAQGALPDEELSRELLDGPDPAVVEKLGLAYLAAGKTGPAQLTLARAVELGSLRAQNALGVANLLRGDASGAFAAYEKALEGPGRDKARANLAALRCRYGDAAGAKRELARVKNPGDLQGPDVDDQWRACR